MTARTWWGGVAITVAAVASAAMIAAPSAQAETKHASTMGNDATVQYQTDMYLWPTQGYASGLFVVKSGRTVQMNCWTTGAQAYGQGKWFQITVGAGYGSGVTGWVPAPTVRNQWLSSPRCP